MRPPIGDPDIQDDEYWLLRKTLYDLRQSPHHCYGMIKGIMLKMGINTSHNYPCLLLGVLVNPSYPETISAVQSQLHVVLYVDDFLF